MTAEQILIELQDFIEFQRIQAESSAKMYSKNEGNLWKNAEELEWGCRCKINQCDLILDKIKRLEAKP